MTAPGERIRELLVRKSSEVKKEPCPRGTRCTHGPRCDQLGICIARQNAGWPSSRVRE